MVAVGGQAGQQRGGDHDQAKQDEEEERPGQARQEPWPGGTGQGPHLFHGEQGARASPVVPQTSEARPTMSPITLDFHNWCTFPVSSYR